MWPGNLSRERRSTSRRSKDVPQVPKIARNEDGIILAPLLHGALTDYRRPGPFLA